MATERTFIMVKPDGVQRGLVGEIIGRFERKGYQLAALKMVSPSQSHLEEHYKDLKTKGFFPSLIKYMQSGPVVAMVRSSRQCLFFEQEVLGLARQASCQDRACYYRCHEPLGIDCRHDSW